MILLSNDFKYEALPHSVHGTVEVILRQNFPCHICVMAHVLPEDGSVLFMTQEGEERFILPSRH